ncbi:hypothetical protein Tco_0789108 [Tanacetum coccineum]
MSKPLDVSPNTREQSGQSVMIREEDDGISVALDPQVLGGNYSFTEQVNSIQQLLAYSLITRTEVDIGEIIYSDLDPSKVTDIELTAHVIAINNRRDAVSPPPLVAKPKKGESQTVALTLPKSQGLEASGALSKKRKKPKSKRPPTETKESPPKPAEGSEQSHLVSSGTVPDPQDLERYISTCLLDITIPSYKIKSLNLVVPANEYLEQLHVVFLENIKSTE